MKVSNQQTITMGTGPFLLQGLFAVLLGLSPILCVFSVIPLAESVLIFGKLKARILGFAGLAILLALCTWLEYLRPLVPLYVFNFVFATILGNLVLQSKDLVKPSLFLGLISFVVLVAGSYLMVKNQAPELTVKEYVMQEVAKSKDQIEKKREELLSSGEKDSLLVADLLNNPEKLWKQLQHVPSYFFVLIFVVIWINLYFLVKRINRLGRFIDFPFRLPTERELTDYRVADFAIFFVLAAFAAIAYGYYFEGEKIAFYGENALRCLGVFYFFQGFGVYLYFLKFLRITGFFHGLLVFLTILTAPQFLAILGMFDYWFEFRTKLSKKIK